jgi:hypothetical protein
MLNRKIINCGGVCASLRHKFFQQCSTYRLYRATNVHRMALSTPYVPNSQVKLVDVAGEFMLLMETIIV